MDSTGGAMDSTGGAMDSTGGAMDLRIALDKLFLFK